MRHKAEHTRPRHSTPPGRFGHRGVFALFLAAACLTGAPAGTAAAPFETTGNNTTAQTSGAEGGGAAQRGVEAVAPQSNVKARGAKGDGRTVTGCSVSPRSQTVTCAGASFTPADVGKKFILPGAGPGASDLATTVSARAGATQVNIGAAASTAVNGREATYGTDDTPAIQAAIGAAQAAGGGVLVFPEGHYLTSGVRVTTPTVQLRGQGWGRTKLSNYSATETTVDVYSAVAEYETAGGVYDMAFIPAVKRATTANELKVFVGIPNFTVDGCLFQNVGRAIKLGDASRITSGYWVRNCRYINCWQFLKLVRAIDGSFRDIVGDLARLDNPVGIHLDGGSEGNTFDSLIVTNATAYNAYNTNPAASAGGGTNLLSDTDEYTAQDAAHTFFTNCYFDAAADGAVFNDGRNFSFTNVWFNGCYRYGAYVGAATTGFSFVNCKFWRSGDAGMLLLGTRHTVRASYAVSNGTRSGVSRAGFQAAATNFIFSGNFAFNGWGGGDTQAYGLVLEPSADNFIVKDNILTGNTATGLLNNGRPGPTRIVSDNLL
ncbi:MAG TPA: right-handed parallel beta-helix repeat-containing protein [Pyrinomonadaceae bacterium]